MTPARDGTDGGRRRLLAGGAALAGAAVLGLTALGCSDDDDDAADGDAGSGDAGDGGSDATTTTAGAAAADGPTTLTAADFAALAPCLLTPEQTEGPFYLSADLERRDLTEGRPGHALRLGLQVVDAECVPVPGAVVDVWHADAVGDYSAFVDGSYADEAGEGTTFLRGSQVANDEGIVEFATVYPGWYPGRAVHVHVKAHLDGATVLTSQLYFPEDLTDEVHAEGPYADRGTRDTRNEDDGIAGDPASAGNLRHRVGHRRRHAGPGGAGRRPVVRLTGTARRLLGVPEATFVLCRMLENCSRNGRTMGASTGSPRGLSPRPAAHVRGSVPCVLSTMSDRGNPRRGSRSRWPPHRLRSSRRAPPPGSVRPHSPPRSR